MKSFFYLALLFAAAPSAIHLKHYTVPLKFEPPVLLAAKIGLLHHVAFHDGIGFAFGDFFAIIQNEDPIGNSEKFFEAVFDV